MPERLTVSEAKALLKEHNQPDLFAGYDKLGQGDRVKFLHQIRDIDWDLIEMAMKGAPKKSLGVLTPPNAIEHREIEERREEFKKRGQFLIRAGKVGAVMLAGGMGTRLGAGKPKGEFNIGTSRVLYIYECLIKNLLTVINDTRGSVPLYIMTNDDNRERTEGFFKIHDYFGYPSKLVTFYTQENNVCVDLRGQLFLDRPGHLASSPNGNGGWFSSMDKANLTSDLHKRGIEWLNVFSVDNVLQRIADPVFIGAVALGNYDSGAKAVRKTSPQENVGLFCNQNGKASVVEYYEMDEATKALRDPDGELTYRFGVTLNYLFSVKKLIKCLETKFPVHYAKKAIPYINPAGYRIEPKEPNGYKFETLAADMVAMMDNCLCFEILRSREFAPIKNATGPDSPQTARELLEANGVRL